MEEENKIIAKVDKEMKRTVGLLEFLIIQPSLVETMVGEGFEKIMIENLIRLKCSKLWAENMVKEIESKCKKEIIEAINKLFEMIEVKKK